MQAVQDTLTSGLAFVTDKTKQLQADALKGDLDVSQISDRLIGEQEARFAAGLTYFSRNSQRWARPRTKQLRSRGIATTSRT